MSSAPVGMVGSILPVTTRNIIYPPKFTYPLLKTWIATYRHSSTESTNATVTSALIKRCSLVCFTFSSSSSFLFASFMLGENAAAEDAVALIYLAITWGIAGLLSILKRKAEPKRRKNKNILKGVVR